MLIAIVPLLAAIVGLLMYALCATGSKPEKVGFVLFWTGTLVTLMSVATHTVKLG